MSATTLRRVAPHYSKFDQRKLKDCGTIVPWMIENQREIKS